MHFVLSQALERLQPLTVAQTARLARLVQRAVNGYRDAVKSGAAAASKETAILAIACQLDSAAEDAAFVLGVEESIVRGLPLADFAEFAAALLARLREVNGADLETRLVPAINQLGEALSLAKAHVPAATDAVRGPPPSAGRGGGRGGKR